MARVEQRAMNVVYSFIDQERTRSKMLIHMTNPLFALIPGVGAPVFLNYINSDIAGAVEPLSDSLLVGVSTTMRSVESPRPTVGGGQGEKKGSFLFGDANGGKLFRMFIPGIKESVLAGNKRDIDLTNALVTAFITEMTTGTIRPVTENNVQLTGVGLGDAYKAHRRSTKGGRRRTG